MNWGPVQVIVRGAYAYYLEQYKKFFPRENMLVLNSDVLKTEPWKVVIKTQKFFDQPSVEHECDRPNRDIRTSVFVL